MSGSLHIFRRSVVNGSTHYQVNYNTANSTYARVFDNHDELRDFLISVAEMSPGEIDEFWTEIHQRNSVTLSDIDISEQDTDFLGFKQSPSE